MIYPWQKPIWERLAGSLERLPHALLIAGPAGGGKRAFAENLARRLLCETPGTDGFACGACLACRWFDAGNHPDFRLVVPESQAEERDEADEDGEAVASESKKKPSNQIRIEQVRALNDFVAVGTHRRGMRLILIDPAEAMNVHTANALLKLLEEPTPSTLFLLISGAPRRLLPTIRSRCQALVFGKPDAALARDWLAAHGGLEDASALLAFAGGMPLAAADLGERDAADYRRQFMAAVTAIERENPLQTAAAWEGWLKRRDESGFVPRLSVLVAWLQKWMFDLVLWKLARRVAFHPDQIEPVARLAGRATAAGLIACYNELHRMRRIAEHPLNPRLFLEDMLLRYARSVAEKGAADG